MMSTVALSTLERPVGHPPEGTVNTLLARQAVDMLNDMFHRDPVAVQRLVEQRILCNAELASHPTIPVAAPGLDQDDDGGGLIGLLGVLNGLCGVWTKDTAPRSHLAHFGPICGQYDGRGRLTGFGLSEETIKP